MEQRWLGLDLGGTKILGVVVDEHLRRYARVKVPTPAGAEAVVKATLGLARELVAANDVGGAGLAFAGLVDGAAGFALRSIVLPGWTRVPLAERLAHAIERPALVENDATAAAFGELCARRPRPPRHMVMLTVGTGIGGALVLDGRLYRGSSGFAGEVGNMSIDWNGPVCWCGNRGCLNTLASGSAIAGGFAVPPQRNGCGAPAAEDGVDGHPRLERAARALGAGIANLVNLLNPELVVLAGGVPRARGPYLRTIREEVARRALPEPAAHVRIERSVLGYDVSAIGAACLARERFGEDLT